jgi:ABC-type glutathione transport system ATPase component
VSIAVNERLDTFPVLRYTLVTKMSVRIKCENVVKRYGDVTVIPGLTLDVREGEFFTLLGPSGCGGSACSRNPTPRASCRACQSDIA